MHANLDILERLLIKNNNNTLYWGCLNRNYLCNSREVVHQRGVTELNANYCVGMTILWLCVCHFLSIKHSSCALLFQSLIQSRALFNLVWLVVRQWKLLLVAAWWDLTVSDFQNPSSSTTLTIDPNGNADSNSTDQLQACHTITDPALIYPEDNLWQLNFILDNLLQSKLLP